MPGRDELLEKLKQAGKRLILLSNIPDTFIEDHSCLPALRHFEAKVFSYSIPLAKPDKRFFAYVLTQYRLDPKDCLFIDDNEDNLASASRLGIDTNLFDKNDPESFSNYVNQHEL